MPLQNRVDPWGRILATPERGLFMGNRGGALHDGNRQIVREQASPAWIICRTEFRGRKRQVMSPGRYTELFFLDEATALAAGHRPCFECRRPDADHFLRQFRRVTRQPDARASDIDARLSGERRLSRFSGGSGKVAFLANPQKLPDGAMVDHAGRCYVLAGARMWPWDPGGFGPAVPLAASEVFVLTPRTTLQVLAAGYRAVLHPSAQISPPAAGGS